MSKKKAAPMKKSKAAARTDDLNVNLTDELNVNSEPALLPSMLAAPGSSGPPPLQKMTKSKRSKAPSKNMTDMFEEAAESVEKLEKSYKESASKSPPSSSQGTRSADGNTITFGPNHDYLQDRETFPLKRLLVTDAVFFAIRQLISVSQNIKPKLSSVIGLRLVGCHFLTDRGVECIGECFPKVKKLYLAGCPNVTEASLAVLAEQCTQLETLDICGTNVAMLPRKLADCILVTDTCPMVSLNPPVPSKDMARVCVVRREGQSNTSVLRLLQGDKELAATQGLGFKPNLPCGKDCLINVIECSQATVDLFTSGWAVYIIPSELKDKTKIEEEAKSIFGIVQSILLKAGTGAFVVVGLNTAGAGVVPTDIIVERVQDLVKNHMTSMETKAIETDPERFSHQLQIDQMERERQCLKSLAISALEVNLDQKDKAVPKLTEHLATLCAKNPESKIFSKALGDFMQGFPEQGGKDFKVGVHTLSGAADILLQGTAFIASLEAQGALDQLIEELGVLGLRGVTGKTLIPFSCLPDTTDISLVSWVLSHCVKIVPALRQLHWTDLRKQKGVFKRATASPCQHQVPASLWQKAMTRITNFHLPLYVWKYGIVVQDGIVELLFTLEGETLTVIAQTISVTTDGTKDAKERSTRMLWQCLEKYKLLLDQLFTRSGLAPKVVVKADVPRPDKITGIVDGHNINRSDLRCKRCGESKDQIAVLQESSAEVEPTLLSADNAKFFHAEEPAHAGRVTGSVISLSPGGTVVVSAGFSGMRAQTCSIILLQGNFAHLKLTLSGAPEKVPILIGNEETLSVIKKSGQGVKEVQRLIPGVGVNITLTPSTEAELDCVVDCHGQLLFQQKVPVSKYRVEIHHIDADGKGKQPPSPSDEIQFTVLSRHFGMLGRSDVTVGMRLEALDRLNPSLVCVATIERAGKGGSLLIHFDGWTNKYDYWAEPDSPDLHPLGYMEEVGKLVGKYNQLLQPPHGYGRSFDWARYLQEESSEPVPYDFFTEEQTAGTKPDKTYSVCFDLGLDYVKSQKHSVCTLDLDRTTVLENWVREQMSKAAISDLPAFVKLNPRVFCLLPAKLDLQFLRYPSLATLFQPDKQSLHMMCPGQNSMYHLVDHPGLNFSSLAKSYSGLELFLQNAYFLLLTNENTIPVEGSELCKGFETVPPEQQYRVELGAKRMYRLYLMLFHFIADPTALKETKEISPAPSLGQHAMQLKTLLEEGFKSHNLGQRFSHSAEFTKVECRAHQSAHSAGLELTTFPTEAFKGMGSSLTWINFSNNKLEMLPTEFSTMFQNLTHLNLENNLLNTLPSLSGFKVLSSLDVSSNQLKSIELTDNLKSSLVSLNISNNPLNSLPPTLAKLGSDLAELSAENIGTIKSLDLLLDFRNLKTLSLNYNVIVSLPDKLVELPLTTLKLAGVPLLPPQTSSTTPLSLNAFLTYAKRWTAMSLLTQEALGALFSGVDTEGVGHLDNDGIVRLNKKMVARFPRLGQVGKIAGASLPPVLTKMHGLTRLDLSYQGFTTVPDEFKGLGRLNVLSLNGCPKLESLTAELATLPLKELHLRDCMSLKTPPKEIVKRGFHAVYGYLKRLQMGSVPCKRTKLMMVGLGGAGKTSLVRALTSNSFAKHNYDEMITDGIDIGHWEVPIKGEQEPLEYSVWDFAGQTVYYNTHQFFLSNRAVYLLLWNIRLGYEHAGLDFWLSSIACHAPKAPVLVVGTHCDKVEKSRIPQAELKKRFPQISSFHFVSSYTKEGLPKLQEDLITVTLQQKYMGEKIPEVWLNLETQLLRIRDKGDKALLPLVEVEHAAQKSGIFDRMELIQAVQFLHDLGSVQFFNTEFLRSNVVIVPQWIVDVMACIVTVHVGPIQKANLIPCLLPDTEAKFKWKEVNRERGEREMKMIYKFDYLPAGLFNRSQVRLQQFSDHAVMWKKGSLLTKNEHTALLQQVSDTEVQVKAQGFKPENMLFLVHEVFECLISESYAGVHYDYLIPCMECMAQNMNEPCMFPKSKVQRAMEFKAPFLQCDTSFHILSLVEIQALMPPDRNSDFDDHLSRSVRELHSLEEDIVISVFVCYSKKNIPSLADEGKVVHPGTVMEDLRAAGYKVSFTDEPETANMETLTLAMKSAQVVLIGISDDFVSNEQCHNLIIYAKETLRKPILLMTLGATSKWQKQNINIVLSNEVYVKMQDITRYDSKIKELIEAVKTKAGLKKVETYPECFISYCWANSKTAADLGSASNPKAQGWGDPRKIKQFLQDRKVPCWLDIEQMGQEGFFEDIAEGLRKAKVMVACVSDEYAESKNCVMEYRFAMATLRIPVILAVVGTGYQWERSPVGMMAVGQGCPQGQPAVRESGWKCWSSLRRKFLRQLSIDYYTDASDQGDFPHLVIIDLGVAHENGSEEEEKKTSAMEVEADTAVSDQYCFRVLCEWEQWSPRSITEFQEEYKRLLDVVSQQDTKQTYGGLHRCHMSSGKQLWLCEKHRKMAGSTVDSDGAGNLTSATDATAGSDAAELLPNLWGKD
ncbi:hypothetical protein BaRGS_00030601 [Batillaria attramentaria]|uniref:non-specific serine/threonine protein kinase n=1 Tax=Batillaria attramentaria TaxID=370345 RepID=A0ABD0JTY2_9CAEN